MPIGGADGLRRLLIGRFGCSLDYATMAGIKEDVRRSLGLVFIPEPEPVGPDDEAAEAAPPEPPVVRTRIVERIAAAPITPPAKIASIDETLQTAIDLVLEAVPNLATLSIAVDAGGEVSCSYTTREVRVVESSGQFTRRK
jgi:hypothetical protein